MGKQGEDDMKNVKRHTGKLIIVLAVAIVAMIIVGCGGDSSTPADGPAPLPSQAGDILPNDSVVLCQIILFGEWDGPYPRTMKVRVDESHDVEGMTNYTKDKPGKEIELTLDEDLDWLMLGQQITGNVQLRANPEGGTSYYLSNVTH